MSRVFIIFSLAMIFTRFPFGGGVLHLLDVSWALFFLLGRLPILQQQKLVYFIWFVTLGWGIDLLATKGAYVSAYCMTPAYIGMPLAYSALLFFGVLSARFSQAKATIVAMSVVIGVTIGSVAAFAISNAFFYQWSGYFVDMSFRDFSWSVLQYLPFYVLTAQVYVLGWFCLDRILCVEYKIAQSQIRGVS